MSRRLALGALSGGLLALAFTGTGGLGWLGFVALMPLLRPSQPAIQACLTYYR